MTSEADNIKPSTATESPQFTVELLKRSVEEWNALRQKYSHVEIDLRLTDLSRTNLRKANLSGANLSGADLRLSDLSGADLRKTNLSGLVLTGAIITVNLSGANLCGADLRETNLSGANLSGANLSRANLRGANLSEFYELGVMIVVDLSRTNLSEADLSGTNLRNANLRGAKLSEANLNRANLRGANLSDSKLSSCVIDTNAQHSLFPKGYRKGVNGIYCSKTDSAALMKLTPQGDSMQSSNADAIIENLKSAKKLHNITLSFAGLCMLIAFLKPEKVTLPVLQNITVDSLHFLVIAILFSVGTLSIVESFMRSALNAAKYINTQDDAMKVGHFPWMLSKYENDFFSKIQSGIIRFLLVFHPIVYPLFFYTSIFHNSNFLFPENTALFLKINSFLIWIVWIAYCILLLLCIKIFSISEGFQKPILFDPETERQRKSETAMLNETLLSIADLLKAKESNNKAES